MWIYTARTLLSHESICHFGISVRGTADMMTYGASKSDTRVGHFDDRLDGKYAKAGVSYRAICGVFGISLSLSHPLYSLLPPIINVHHNRLGSTVPFIATLAHDTHHCAMLIFEMLLDAISLFRAWKLKSIMLVWNYRVELWRPFVGHIKHTMVCFKCAFMATLIQVL